MLQRLLILTLLLCLSSCNKEDHRLAELQGKWFLSTDYSLTIDFVDFEEVLINGNEYLYKICDDSIEFSYSGPLYIYIPTSMHYYKLSNQNSELSIDDLSKTFFFKGEDERNLFLKDTLH